MDSTPNDGYFEAYWPRGVRKVTSKQLAPRPATLDGKRIAFLWDYLFRGDAMYGVIQEEFTKRYPGISFSHWDEWGSIHGNDERRMVAELPAKLKAAGIDAVITSVAA
ncbi:hypothetical protein [Xylophilus sp. GOD-11R]|uniref:UGSC family (seleno)protein n=1 Tax=Xylophilus sp. GOD-11R TaxID=3089814 RepID=UPI00298BEB00|nr:hypothetical protein [Xylophilus sp. GOD-11R]WPB55922.1 hypothetical protein R9X41_17470 [Xylophilus sp. GOD-11R]